MKIALANTFIGSSSGLNSTTGSSNTFVGESAGNTNTTGSSNTMVGYNTGTGNQSGIQNTFLGANAGDNLIGFGSDNVMLGFQARSSGLSVNNAISIGSDAVVTASNSIAIGQNASANAANSIAIGTGATVSTANSMVLGDIGANAVNVGIGMTAPLTTLDVLGALSLRDDGTNVSINSDNQLVTIGNRGHIRLSSNDGTLNGSFRTITLSDGVVIGQLLIIENADATSDAFEVADDPVNRNTNTSGNRQIDIGDIITLMWTGTFWNELSYADN